MVFYENICTIYFHDTMKEAELLRTSLRLLHPSKEQFLLFEFDTVIMIRAMIDAASFVNIILYSIS